MRIDSHHHYWKIDRGDYGWMSPDLTVLNRDYLPGDLLPHLDRHKIDKTVIVQAADTIAETDFILVLAEGNDRVGGVVGWLDMEADDFEDKLTEYRSKSKFVGIRPVIHDISDDAWMIRPKVLESFKHLADLDFPFEFLTFSRHLPFVLQVLENVPGLRAVMDHISKPEIKDGNMQPWQDLLKEVAAHPNAYCKMSGMITEADHEHWTVDDLRPYVDHVLECFGPDRLMYGSDWPVCLLAGSYERVIGAAETLTSDMDEDSKAKVFGGNAVKFYNL